LSSITRNGSQLAALLNPSCHHNLFILYVEHQDIKHVLVYSALVAKHKLKSKTVSFPFESIFTAS